MEGCVTIKVENASTMLSAYLKITINLVDVLITQTRNVTISKKGCCIFFGRGREHHPKAGIDAYTKIARDAAKLWMEHGALSVTECVADDVPYGDLTSFPRAVQATDDEVVVFSWIVYDSRESRDEVNKKVMADERMKDLMSTIEVDGKRMIFGGFRPIVEA